MEELVESKSFEEFALVCEKISGTTKKLAKVSLLSDYLKALQLDADLQISCRFLTGQIFPLSSQLEATVGYSAIISAVSRVSDLRRFSLSELFVRLGDLGEVVQELLRQKSVAPLSTSLLTLGDVYATFERIARTRGKDSNRKKAEQLRGLFLHASPLSAKYIAKFVTKETRIGLVEGLVEEALARAFNRPLDTVRVARFVLGDIGETALSAKRDTLEAASIDVFRPTNFMLADTMQTSSEIQEYYKKPVLAEYKYDGIRVQIHKKGKQVRIYSRNLSPIEESFPELSNAAKNIGHDFVLDAEVLPYKNGRPISFQFLQTRLRRKDVTQDLVNEVPVVLKVYDVLFLDERPTIYLSLLERKKLLESIIDIKPPLFLSDAFGVNSAEEIQDLFEKSKSLGYEGLVVKDPYSPYLPGKRGKHWLKLKKELDTLDVVIVGTEYGHGKRKGVLSDYTFAVRSDSELLTVGKAYSGLTDEEIDWMTSELLKIVVEDRGYYKVVTPKIVLEVAFDAIQKSDRHNSGYALRFPRIKRIRLDKSVHDIDSINRVKKIWENQKR